METQTQKPLLLKKEGRYVYITNRDLKKTVRFDLSTQVMERKHKRTGVWEPVKHQYGMFKNLSLNDIDYEDEKFKKLLELSIKTHKKDRSLSTYISTLDKVLTFEPYIQQGFKCSISNYGYRYNYGLNLPKLQDIPKPYLQMLKEIGTEITHNFRYEPKHSKMWEQALGAMETLEFTPEQKRTVFKSLNRYSSREAWNYLVDEMKFQPRALLGYLVNYLAKFEGLDFRDGITTLRDYYRMANRIGRNVEKYPKYLHSMHDIIQANYASYKKEYNEELFQKVIKPELEYKSKEFSMINPMSPKDIVKEGTDNNHCVGSYVDDIISDKTYIIFLRKNDTKEEPEQSKKSLITVELDLKEKEIIQARGSYNRAPTPEEKEFMEEYAKKMKMEVTY